VAGASPSPRFPLTDTICGHLPAGVCPVR